MKMKLATVAGILLSVSASQAAVTVSGTGATGLKDTNGAALSTGSLVLWIADTNGNGFGSLTNQSVAVGTTLNVGDSFGGDTIMFRASSTQFSSQGRVASGWNYDNPAAAGGAIDLAPGTKFAIVWFSTSTGAVTAATTSTAEGMFYGVAGVDNTAVNGGWLTGAQTSGSVGFSTTGTYTTANPFKGLVAADFTTSTTAGFNNAQGEFALAPVPEPSAALLGMLGALGLLRRRR